MGTGDFAAEAELIHQPLGASVDLLVSEALAHVSLREAEDVERLVAEAHVPKRRWVDSKRAFSSLRMPWRHLRGADQVDVRQHLLRRSCWSFLRLGRLEVLATWGLGVARKVHPRMVGHLTSEIIWLFGALAWFHGPTGKKLWRGWLRAESYKTEVGRLVAPGWWRAHGSGTLGPHA